MAASDVTMPSTGAMPELARCGAVLVAHARLDLAQRCVASLRRWLAPEQIVVVLNLADTGRPDELAGEAVVISPPAPRGYGANLNFGVEALPASVDFVVLANDDVVFEDESLPRLLDVLRDDPTVGIVGPRLLNADGTEATSFARFPSIGDAILGAAILPGPVWRAEQRRRQPSEPRVEFVVGAATLVRRASFDAVGGFDDDFFLNYEETDLCYRLQRAGWRVAWCPEAVVTHFQGSSISRELNFASYYASLRLYYEKRLGPLRWLLFELLLIGVYGAGVAYSALASLVRPRSLGRRYEEVRLRWRTRIFLRRARRGRP